MLAFFNLNNYDQPRDNQILLRILNFNFSFKAIHKNMQKWDQKNIHN